MTELAIVDTQTGEYIKAGEYTLDTCAHEANAIIESQEKNNWQLGKVLSIARALCESKDCGIDGDNPKARYGAWVSTNLGDTSNTHLHRVRCMFEVFGQRQGEVSHIPQSALYALAQPQCDEVREDILEELNGRVTCAMVEEKIQAAIRKEPLVLKHTGDEESYTPEEYIESARRVMGSIDLDPASNDMAQDTVNADEYFTIDDNGLEYKWAGNVWLNPPYTARVIDKFVDKLVHHCQSGDVKSAILLTNNNTDTKWFVTAAVECSAVCFTTGRINFLKRDGSTSSPTNGQAFLYFGKDRERFKEEFSKYGLVMALC